MSAVAEVGPPVSLVLVAALLLAAGEHLRALDLPRPTVEQVIGATGASRSRAYELRDALLTVLPSLLRPVGRPSAPPRPVDPDTAHDLRGDVVTFVMDHPGCVYGGPDRRRYDDTFRHFVLELREQHADVDLDHFADAIRVPLGTLKEWLGRGTDPGAGDLREDAPTQDEAADGDNAGTTSQSAEIETVLSSWKTWRGSFGDFCTHVRDQQRVSFGPSLISQILFVNGQRRPRRRGGRSPDERALRRAFETFFGGAQWVGDGSPIPVTLNGQRFDFNLELNVDAFSGGFVGMSVRDEEDSAAVTEALADGIANTQEAPLAILLDNRPSNHTPQVDAALGDVTLRIRATSFRPQNKAHVEGGFGLFQQSVPALDLRGQDPRELARQVLVLVAQTWARTLNHRPRGDRAGRSRVELYNEPITAEQVDAARAALEERCKKQNRARLTALARQDPIVRALLDDAFLRLDFLDPEHHLRVAIARYPIDIVVEGIAIFEAKRRVATLPPGVDARYLLGIVQNLGNEREGIAIAQELLRARLDARDRMLAPLVEAREDVRRRATDLRDRVLHFVDLALATDRPVDRLFWLLALSDEISHHAGNEPAPLIDTAARRAHATHRVPYRERLKAVRIIVENVVPLA
jgi:hypothetical protein